MPDPAGGPSRPPPPDPGAQHPSARGAAPDRARLEPQRGDEQEVLAWRAPHAARSAIGASVPTLSASRAAAIPLRTAPSIVAGQPVAVQAPAIASPSIR